MERGHEQPFAGQQSARDHLRVTSGTSQRRAENTSDKLALDENSSRFYEDERVSRRAEQWALDPWTFFKGVPQRCIACQLWMRIQALSSEKRQPGRPKGSKLPKEETQINTIELRIYLVFFHLLRAKFHELFYAKGSTDPLIVYLSTHGLGEQASLSASFTKMDRRGGCYHELTTRTNRRGVLLLSTAFSIETLETKGELGPVSAAAAEDIQGISAIQIYDKAVDGIFGIFETSLRKWIDSMAQRLSYNLTPVQHLINLQVGYPSDQSPSCPPPFDTPLVTVPETSAAPETFFAVPQMTTVAVDVHGAQRYYDASMVLLMRDTSGTMTQVRVGALAEGSNSCILTAGTQWNLYPPSSEVTNESIYTAAEWPNLLE